MRTNNSLSTVSMRQKRWLRIRQTAIDLFESRGYAAVSIADIAEAADVSRRTFFNHFPTKMSVLFEPDPTETQELLARLDDRYGSGADLWATVTLAISDYVTGPGYRVAEARRRLLRSDPALGQHHVAANVHFERTIKSWLDVRADSAFGGRLLGALALAVVHEAFMTWDPDGGAQALQILLDEGFAMVANGVTPH